MTRYIVKFFIALGLAVLIYSIGVPGCSPNQFATVRTATCEDFGSRFTVESCQRIPVDDGPGPDEDYGPGPDEGYGPGEGPEPDEGYGPGEGPGTTTSRQRPPKPPVKDLLEFYYRVSLGKVDIIFVIDNSSSMAFEHRSLASQFDSFLNSLKDVDYHIAVITTDISSSPDNPVSNKKYQDGKFLPIGNRIFLRNENLGRSPPKSVVDDFKKAIKREETEDCDTPNQPTPSSSGNQYDDLYREADFESTASTACPSPDERGTYALNLAIRNQRHKKFFRSDEAHLMMIILSDEDIRSSKEYINQLGAGYAEKYAFEDFDYPEILVESISNRFPLKSFSFYPIIIIPGDTECHDIQLAKRRGGRGTGRGFYGTEYARLATATDPALARYGNLLKGRLISICNRRYGKQLSKVAMEANTIKIPLPCGEPESVTMFINNDRVRVNYSIEKRTLIIQPGRVSLDSVLNLRVRCEAN